VPWFRKPKSPPKLAEYGLRLVRTADHDSGRLTAVWQQGGLDLSSEERLRLFYEFTLFYLHLTDRFVAEHLPDKREQIMNTVMYVAWYDSLARSVAAPISDDPTDPDTAESWRGFTEDLHLRHQLFADYVWEGAIDDAEGTLFWEFARFVSRSFGRPDDFFFVSHAGMAMEGCIRELNWGDLVSV
jgi:hypothetical protein